MYGSSGRDVILFHKQRAEDARGQHILSARRP
jgi:hypothetical protein